MTVRRSVLTTSIFAFFRFQIFSRYGKQINCFVPPATHTSSNSPRPLTVPVRPVSSLPTFDRTPTTGSGSTHALSPTNTSPTLSSASLHMATTTTIGIQDRVVVPSRNSAHRQANSTPRGQFGGVCVTTSLAAGSECPDNLGRCLLASYSDRKRSGVAVWPQCYWAQSLDTSGLDQEAIEQDANSTALIDGSGRPISHWTDLNSAPLPYLIEVEPGFRRLAGLLALPDSRQLVVVDQGAQSLCRIRYA